MKRSMSVAVAALALVAVACGGSEAAESDVASLEITQPPAIEDDGASVEGTSDEEQVLAFTECLRTEGLDVGDASVDSEGNIQLGGVFQDLQQGAGDQGIQGALGDAFDACGELIEGLQLGFAGGNQTDFEDQILEFAQCMRDNGYDMDDPDFSNFGPGAGGDGDGQGGGPGGPFGDLDFDDPDFQLAQDACADVLAGFGPGVGGGANG